MNWYKLIIKPLVFQLSPESAHHFSLKVFQFLLGIPLVGNIFRKSFTIKNPKLKRNILGLDFENPVGLAAGFDKDGKYFNTMAALGFGFIEIGTVTPRPQKGNPKPRLFRLPKDEAIINRMGFNNDGIDALLNQLQKKRPKGLIIGGNIGKNKDTPNETAFEDYLICFEKLFPYVDYFTLNVSSPNTPNLRELQNKEPLLVLIGEIQKANKAKEHPKPILLKIAPDLSNGQLDEILEITQEAELDGIIATNTTVSREPLNTGPSTIQQIGNGGLSGQPLRQRSTEIIRYLREHSKKEDLLIIGVGGIASPSDALEKMEAGASLVQIYTGLIYEGPTLVRNINKALIH